MIKITELSDNDVIEKEIEMRPSNDKLAQQILAAAKAEFFEKDFRNASMRSIASAAAAATGAIYRYYANKEALFDVLVAEPAEEFFNEYKAYSEDFLKQELNQQLTTLPQLTDKPNGEIEVLMKYIYQHYDAFKLIACCSVGTQYENYIERLTEIETNSGAVIVHLPKKENRMAVDMDDTLIHIISNTIFTGIFEIISHDNSAENAEKHINALYDFYTAGWYEILGVS